MHFFYRQTPKKTILLLFILCSLFACQRTIDKTEIDSEICDEPNFDTYIFCEQYATAAEKAWEAKQIGLMRQIHLFFDAIKCNDIPRADLYASKYGLGTLLYLNLTTISFYEVLDYQIYGKTAFVRIKLNKNEAVTTCIFKQENEQPNTWFFHGIDTNEAFSKTGTNKKYGYKVKFQQSLP